MLAKCAAEATRHDDSAAFDLNADLTPSSNTGPDLMPKPSRKPCDLPATGSVFQGDDP
jgi:hypothetical protein